MADPRLVELQEKLEGGQTLTPAEREELHTRRLLANKDADKAGNVLNILQLLEGAGVYLKMVGAMIKVGLHGDTILIMHADGSPVVEKASLAEAAAAATSGDSILLTSRTWAGDVTLPAGVTLWGFGAVLSGTVTGPASGVAHIYGCTIQGTAQGVSLIIGDGDLETHFCRITGFNAYRTDGAGTYRSRYDEFTGAFLGQEYDRLSTFDADMDGWTAAPTNYARSVHYPTLNNAEYVLGWIGTIGHLANGCLHAHGPYNMGAVDYDREYIWYRTLNIPAIPGYIIAACFKEVNTAAYKPVSKPFLRAWYTDGTYSENYYTAQDANYNWTTLYHLIPADAAGKHASDWEAGDSHHPVLTKQDTTTIALTLVGQLLSAAVIPGGIKLDDLGAPDDTTDLDASAAKHGLLKKLSGVATQFLNGLGNWVAVAWGDITGKPVSFPPTAHTHGGAEITSSVANSDNATNASNSDQLGDVPASYFVQGTNAQRVTALDKTVDDLDTLTASGFYSGTDIPHAPVVGDNAAYFYIMVHWPGTVGHALQIAQRAGGNHFTDEFWIRLLATEGNTPWKRIGDMSKSTYDTDNDGKVDAAQVADTAGDAETLGGLPAATSGADAHVVATDASGYLTANFLRDLAGDTSNVPVYLYGGEAGIDNQPGYHYRYPLSRVLAWSRLSGLPAHLQPERRRSQHSTTGASSVTIPVGIFDVGLAFYGTSVWVRVHQTTRFASAQADVYEILITLRAEGANVWRNQSVTRICYNTVLTAPTVAWTQVGGNWRADILINQQYAFALLEAQVLESLDDGSNFVWSAGWS